MKVASEPDKLGEGPPRGDVKTACRCRERVVSSAAIGSLAATGVTGRVHDGLPVRATIHTKFFVF